MDLALYVSPWTEPSGCRPWLGALNAEGRALAWDAERRQAVPAARVLWAENFGAIAVGLEVLHLCDTAYCINAEHLVLGLPAANVFDRVRKNRSARGRAPGGPALLLAQPAASAVREAHTVRARHRARLRTQAVQLQLIA